MKKFNLFDITCRQATYLSTKREEGKLSVRERLLLHLHLKTCGPCRMFIDQIDLIKNRLKSLKKQIPEFSDLKLSDHASSVIQQKIDELAKSQK